MLGQKFLSDLSGWVFLAGFVPLTISIVRGYYVPPKATWFIWAVIDAMYVIDMYRAGSLNGQTLGGAIGSLSIALLSIKYGESGWSFFQKVLCSAAALGILASTLVPNIEVGIIVTSLVLVLGGSETFVDAWLNPEHYSGLLSRWAWSLYAVSCVFAVLAIPAISIKDVASPLTFSVIDIPIVALCYLAWRPKK